MPIAPENRHRYPTDWDELRHALLEEAGYRCECDGRCGRGHRGRCIERHLQLAVTGGAGVRVVLTIAHLDHTPEHNDRENLMVACQGCHLHYDIDHHLQSARARAAQALEAAGQLPLQLDASTGDTSSLETPDASPAAAAVAWLRPATGVDTRRDDPAARFYSLRAVPVDVAERLAIARAVHAHAEQALAAARGELAAACALTLEHGAQVNELADYAAGSRPRLYRLIDEHRRSSHAA